MIVIAAPTKQGLDYFPLEVGLFEDSKFLSLEPRYGHNAKYIFVVLLTLLYRDKGYYIPYKTTKDKNHCHLYIYNLCRGRHPVSTNIIADVIRSLAEENLLDLDSYSAGVITSKRAQINYYRATVERKSVIVDNQIWLLKFNEMLEISSRHFLVLPSNENQPNNLVNRTINLVNQPINPQSKVKVKDKKKIYINNNTISENFLKKSENEEEDEIDNQLLNLNWLDSQEE